MGTAPLVATEPPLISDPAIYGGGVPHEEFARRRRECPVDWVEEKALWRYGAGGAASVRGSGYWAVMRHETVAAVSRNPAVFSSGERGGFLPDPKSRQDLERTRQLLINMDAPEHRRIRRFVAAAFSPRTMQLLEEGIRAHARRLVAAALDREEVDDYKRTFSEAFEYALELAAAKRRRPGDDLVSELVRLAVDPGHLSEREYCNLWVLLVVAGNETTRHLLSGGILALLEWPEERGRLVADPGLTPLAVEELLRWVSPVMQFRRTATCDVELEGRRVRAGDKGVLYYASADRDESVFPDADRLAGGPQPNPQLAFGVGPHFCLGAHLARLEAAALVDELRPHLASLQVSGEVVRLESNFMSGIKSMPARFGGARA